MTAQNTLIIDICYFKLQYQASQVKSPGFLVTFYNSLTEKKNFFWGGGGKLELYDFTEITFRKAAAVQEPPALDPDMLFKSAK